MLLHSDAEVSKENVQKGNIIVLGVGGWGGGGDVDFSMLFLIKHHEVAIKPLVQQKLLIGDK